MTFLFYFPIISTIDIRVHWLITPCTTTLASFLNWRLFPFPFLAPFFRSSFLSVLLHIVLALICFVLPIDLCVMVMKVRDCSGAMFIVQYVWYVGSTWALILLGRYYAKFNTVSQSHQQYPILCQGCKLGFTGSLAW